MDWETPGLADRIREALSAFLPHGGRDADIWVRLPDGQDELRHYRIPKVSPKDRDAIAKMTAIREKPFDEAENIFDYRVDAEVLDKGVPRLPVTAMIANKGAVNTVRHTLAAAGVSPAGITSGNIYAQNLFASGWLSSPWEHFAFADRIFSNLHIVLVDAVDRSRGVVGPVDDLSAAVHHRRAGADIGSLVNNGLVILHF